MTLQSKTSERNSRLFHIQASRRGGTCPAGETGPARYHPAFFGLNCQIVELTRLGWERKKAQCLSPGRSAGVRPSEDTPAGRGRSVVIKSFCLVNGKASPGQLQEVLDDRAALGMLIIEEFRMELDPEQRF